MNITITEVRNAVSVRADDSCIDVEINHPEFGWIPYTISSSDDDNTINNTEIMALIGTNFDAYTPPTVEALSIDIRIKREDLLLTNVDPIVTNPLRWAELTVEKQNEWIAYRTALLDITEQADFPHSVEWPVMPS